MKKVFISLLVLGNLALPLNVMSIETESVDACQAVFDKCQIDIQVEYARMKKDISRTSIDSACGTKVRECRQGGIVNGVDTHKVVATQSSSEPTAKEIECRQPFMACKAKCTDKSTQIFCWEACDKGFNECAK